MTLIDNLYNGAMRRWAQFERDHPRLVGALRPYVVLVWRTWEEFNQDHGPTHAAALAYSALFALFPLLLGLIGILAFLLAQGWSRATDALNYLLAFVQTSFPGAYSTIVDTIRQVTEQRGAISVWAAILLLFSGSVIFEQFQYSLDVIFDCPPRQRNPFQLALAKLINAALALSIIVLLFLGVVLNTIVAIIEQNFAWLPYLDVLRSISTPIVSIALTTLLFAILFKFVPQERLRFAAVFPAAFIGALLWEIGKQVLTWYLSRPFYSLIYGPLAGSIVLLSWVYYSAMIFLLSAELAATDAQIKAEQAKASSPE